ncbi:DNA-binding transcriptional LysR family regulator [Psychromicrobium silvestre]|uniref:DNA-binding transcriptional LysR family regulator n=2 Tax=Psychromicrobium silvestre TaxID=1645614 RepID=A0A7Y9S8Y6_9MICC|nr:DNA-binding transcriptional LysR family regulator [Psychromicrobium silvestre]
MIDVMAVRALVAVSQYGSVISAAESLGYSPSAISQQIKKLEKQAGGALLERHGRGVLLTERGLSMSEQGRRVLEELEGLEVTLMADPSKPSGPVRVSAFSTSCRGLVGPLIRRLEQQGSEIQLRVIAEDPRESVERVANGEADLALVHNWNSVPLPIPEQLQTTDLCDDRADVLVHREHPLAGRGSVCAADLLDEWWMATPVGMICHEALMRMFAEMGILPKIRLFDADFSTHIGLVELGVGVALVPRLGRPELPADVVALELRAPAQNREVKIVYRRSLSASPAINHLVAELKDIAKAL